LLLADALFYYGGLLWEQVGRWSSFIAHGQSPVIPLSMLITLPWIALMNKNDQSVAD
jgi:hypothetical protein